MTKPSRLSPLCAALLPLALISGPSAADQKTNFDFRVRVKLQGDLAALDMGLKVICTVSYSKGEERPFFRAEQDISPAGAVPNAPNGYLDTIVTLKDIPVAFNTNPNAENGDMFYACFVKPIEALETGDDFVDNRRTAMPPADIGTCDTSRGYVSMTGESKKRALHCATKRLGTP